LGETVIGDLRPLPSAGAPLSLADRIDAELIGECGLGEHMAEDAGVGERGAVGVYSDVAEGVEA
jgi:hypothetical protein